MIKTLPSLAILGVRIEPITENGVPGWRVYYVCRWSEREAAESVARRAGATVAEARAEMERVK